MKQCKSLQKERIWRAQEKTQGAKVIGIILGVGGGLVIVEVANLNKSLQKKPIWRAQERAQGTKAIGIIRGAGEGLVTGEGVKLK